MVSYALTIFLSAFLLFQVQPLIGKYILPWFGGGPAVWTVCMLFFQVLLLGGYLYAHLLATFLPQRRQIVVHAALIALALLLLPVTPSGGVKPGGNENPTWQILSVLTAAVGLPYFLLASTGPLLQAWYNRLFPGISPYRLYALSNAGSLLALLTYPFIVEPALRLKTQSAAWSIAFGVFGALCTYCALKTRTAAATFSVNAPAAENFHSDEPDSRPRFGAALLWLLLAACGSMMLLSITNQICADIAVVPFLWVLPLSLYLLTFILCFESERFYFRPVFWSLLAGAVIGILWMLEEGVNLEIRPQIIGFSAVLFISCMVCHGELVRLKPGPRYLTFFYLLVSAGGALGGIFVTLIAPEIFREYLELHVGVWFCCALALTSLWYEQKLRCRWQKPGYQWAYTLLSLAALFFLGDALQLNARQSLAGADSVSLSRNFYGVLRVTTYYANSPEVANHTLQHGRVSHGCQFLSEARRRQATSYYSDRSGVGQALLLLQSEPGLRIGVVGLGVGTLSTYGKEGDHFTFYEINPAVKRLATTKFTYLKDSFANCDIVIGDARISLERQKPQRFDMLVLDAFNSDAIPVHLLTREAFGVYLKHLKKNGILAVHITNRYLDLSPVIDTLAQYFGLSTVLIDSEFEEKEEIDGATWMMVTANKRFLASDPIRTMAAAKVIETGHRFLWTDDYSNLFGIMK